MITEDYVSFKVAKLLKEKGFDEECFMFWRYDKANDKDDTDGISLSGWNVDDSNRATNSKLDKYFDDEFRSEGYSAPTIQMAMKWLRAVHNIFIAINTIPDTIQKPYFFKPYVGGKIYNFPLDYSVEFYTTYEEAAEAAIKYCLENLI